jgi:hypothetical protein
MLLELMRWSTVPQHWMTLYFFGGIFFAAGIYGADRMRRFFEPITGPTNTIRGWMAFLRMPLGLGRFRKWTWQDDVYACCARLAIYFSIWATIGLVFSK